jgi:hypothetical protein
MKAVLLLALAVGVSAQTYRVSGVLVDARNSSPLPRAHVALAGGRNVNLAVTTVADGKFSFDVPPGKYTLNAEHRNWHEVFGLAGPSTGFGSAIVTGPDQDTAHLVFRWFRPGAIFGKVADDHGEPVENAAVQMIRETVTSGRRVTAVVGSVRTDDLGNYRTGPIAGGNYYLVVTGSPWYAKQLALPGVPQTAVGSPLNVAYAPTYYPNAIDPESASRLVLDAGGEAKADFTLRSVAGVSIYPLCHGADPCNGSISLYAPGVDGLEALVSTTYLAGSQAVSGVAPGRYVVRFTTAGGSMRKVIDVGSGGATVEIALQPAPRLTGVVHFKNPGAKPRSTLYVRLSNETTNTATAIAVEPDGRFSFPAVALARLRPALVGSDGYFISDISATGAALKDGVLDLVEGGQVLLNIEASDETGRVRGLVMNADKPVPGALVVLAARAASSDLIRYRGFQTESDGSYDFTGVPAGEYVLFTTDCVDLEYAVPEALRPFLASAKAMTVESHQVYTENLTVH